MKDAKRIASYLLVGVVALLLRTLNLDCFAHTDEVNFWVDRSYRFLDAVQNGHMAGTAISTHPGVTTMWLGSMGVLLHRWLFAAGVLHDGSFPVLLIMLRLPVGITHTVGILVGYLLLRRLFSPLVALLAALLWATDPFVTALSRLLHVDGLTGTFTTLSLLAACVYWNHARRTRWLLLSGASAALALLSKSPGLAVLPVVGLLALSHLVGDDAQAQPWPQRIRSFLLPLLGWGGAFLVTIVLVWPAVWAAPARVYDLLFVGVSVEGGTEHMVPNFFLGAMNPVPGPLYYPVVLAIRMTPWVLIGLLLLSASRYVRRHTLADPTRPDPTVPVPVSCDLAVLAGFVLLFVAAMSMFPKQLDRYMVPVFPALDILAAAGLGMGLDAWAQTQRAAGVRRLLPWGIGVVALVNAAWWHPYGVAYFNQALGGIQMGVHTILVGEGEGLGDAARWLNAQPDITGVVTTSTMNHSLQAFLRTGAQAVSEDGERMNEKTGYVLVYIRHMQRWWTSPPEPPYDQFYGRVPPVHTVTVHGVDYAYIYQVPAPVAQRIDADFGAAFRLYGYQVDTASIRASGTLSLTLEWYARQPVTDDYTLFVHVFDQQGRQVGQIDVPPGGTDQPSHTWNPYGYVSWTHPVPIPADTPPGDYWIALGLYHPGDFARLPLVESAAWGAERAAWGTPPDDGANVLFLKPLRIE